MKYYFTKKQPGFCYTLEYWKQEMEEAQINTLELVEAIITPAKDAEGWFYCKIHGEVGEGNCGKVCEEYKPRNGKSGRCRHHRNMREPGSKTKILTKPPGRD
jgi:hypothetical protein